jgi:hypothetical protein
MVRNVLPNINNNTIKQYGFQWIVNTGKKNPPSTGGFRASKVLRLLHKYKSGGKLF